MFIDPKNPATRAALLALLGAAIGPQSPAEWFARKNPDAISFGAVVENERPCKCGGKDGVIVTVSNCAETAPGAHNHVLVHAFAHHDGDRVSSAFLAIEEAKQLVNRLGEAIAVAERIDAEGTPK